MKFLSRHIPQPSDRLERWVKRLALVATIGMFLVLMMGSTVTNTGSAEGCGRHWPLCQGEFIPSYAVETAIEFSHRVLTGIEGVLIAATSAGALLIRRGNREVKVLVGIMVGTLVLQSAMGAAAVMWPQSPWIMASHFGISMTCFAAVFLLTRYLYEPQSLVAPAGTREDALPPLFGWGIWGALAGSVLVAYVGAYMRHSGNELACATWPLCNGKVFPGFDGPEGIAYFHRLIAALMMLVVYALAYGAWKLRMRFPGFYPVLLAAAVTITLQALAGGAVVRSELDLWTTLLHAALMAWLFVFLTDASRQVLKARIPAEPRPSVEHAAGRPATAGD
jgi:cytochrome c oxidase assembly protein subunit 15